VLSWRSVLFPVLALAVAASALLTALQLITGSETLALLFPWRLTVFLVPVSAALVLAAATKALLALGRLAGGVGSRFTDHPDRLRAAGRAGAAVLAGLVISVSIVAGAERIIRLDAEPKPSPIGRAIAAARLPGDLYLTPPMAYALRIDAAIPVYVDYKTHPYKDSEVLEWRRRLRQSTRAYAGGRLRCERLRLTTREEGITHVIVRKPTRGRCSFLDKSYAVDDYTVYSVERRRPRRT
jgi:hypothetical protein